MKATINLSKIKWDKGGDRVSLPRKLVCWFQIEESEKFDEDRINELICDVLSEETGYCVEDYRIDSIAFEETSNLL